MKKLTAIVLVAVLCAAFAAGCSDSPKSVDDYLQWTKSDWDKASSEQKTEVAEKLIVAIGETMVEGFGDMFNQVKEDPAAKSEFDAQISEMESQITSYFDQDPNGTLNGVVEQASDLMGGLLTQ